MTGKWFVYDEEDRALTFVDSEEKAVKLAEDKIDWWSELAIADGEWSEEVTGVTYGRIYGRAILVDHQDGSSDCVLDRSMKPGVEAIGTPDQAGREE